MKIRLTILLVFIFLKLTAQNDTATFVNSVSENDSISYLFRLAYMPRCYSSDRLKILIPPKEHFGPTIINDTAFNSLNAFEHFVHAFYYPEWYYQSCSMFGYPSDILQTIPAFLPRQGEGLIMSERQRAAITQHRDSTIILLDQCIKETISISDNFKREIISLRAFELIPTLIAAAQDQSKIHDPYILTTLCLLMQYTYEPFIHSDMYKKMYSSDFKSYNYSNIAYKNAIPFTEDNYRLIIKFANDYYKKKLAEESEFVSVSHGIYQIGEKGHSINPIRKVEIQSFEISRYEITNKQFKQFIESTDYITLAEKNKDAFVFRIGLAEFEWIKDSTANWMYPNGISQGGIEDKMNHPVTCISFVDAEAYCKWTQVRLPTMEEWEVASRGNNFSNPHYFGDSLILIYNHANIWHGKTHLMEYSNEDYITTSPVGSFVANPFGIYDIYGNVFEFCSNIPPAFKDFKNVAVTRGGSWWCSFNACGFFNSVDIGRVKKEASFSNNGFRVVR